MRLGKMRIGADVDAGSMPYPYLSHDPQERVWTLYTEAVLSVLRVPPSSVSS